MDASFATNHGRLLFCGHDALVSLFFSKESITLPIEGHPSRIDRNWEPRWSLAGKRNITKRGYRKNRP